MATLTETNFTPTQIKNLLSRAKLEAKFGYDQRHYIYQVVAFGDEISSECICGAIVPVVPTENWQWFAFFRDSSHRGRQRYFPPSVIRVSQRAAHDKLFCVHCGEIADTPLDYAQELHIKSGRAISYGHPCAKAYANPDIADQRLWDGFVSSLSESPTKLALLLEERVDLS